VSHQGGRAGSPADTHVDDHRVAEDVVEPALATTDELLRLAAVVGRRLHDLGATVSTAESCTGGLVAHVLTEISGSSAWFMGGAVAYSDTLKQRLVDVPSGLIERHGAVSDAVAAAMAAGARTGFGTDLALAVTGIAGPTGGTAAKPVGLVFLAVSDVQGTIVERHVWGGDRSANKRQSAHALLWLLLRRLAPDGTTAHPGT
jgi:PncC family amidohydrolase